MRLQVIERGLNEPARARPSYSQEQSPFFRLPWELRIVIYNGAYPRIHSPQLICIEVGGRISFNNIGHAPSAKQRLCRIVCNGLFEDNGAEIRARRANAHHAAGLAGRTLLDSGLKQHQHYSRCRGEFVFPLPLLLACRRMYEDVAPHCDQSLAFQDFLALEVFFERVCGSALASGLLDRLNRVSLDVKFSSDDAFRPSSRKKILVSWAAACKRLTEWKEMRCFRLRLEIPLSQQRSVPGNIHIPIIKELTPVAAHTPDIEVEMMLTSLVHPRSEQIRVYEPGLSEYHVSDFGFEVPGWRARRLKWGRLEETLGVRYR